MDIIITSWALDSYLELKHAGTFSENDYKTIIRPDVLLLQDYPDAEKFEGSKFWSPAETKGKRIPGGFKMKWHNLGPKRAQLRLPVGMFEAAYLCNAYVKTDPKYEARQLAKFKTRLELIRRERHTIQGRLS